MRCLLAALLTGLAGTAFGVEIVLQDGLDGYQGTHDCLLYAPSSVADINYGIHPGLSAGMNRWGEYQVAIVRFDLAELPADLTVESAHLELYADSDIYPFRDITVQATAIAPANAGWIEGENDGTRTPVPGTPCWNWLAYGARKWAGDAGLRRSGVDFDPALTAQATVPAKAQAWVSLELPPNVVQRWLDDPGTNAGLRICPAEPDLEKGDAVSFAASEYDRDHALRPRLILTVTDRPGLASELDRVKFTRTLADLVREADAYANQVAAAGKPPRAVDRLRSLQRGLANLTDRFPPEPGPARNLAAAIAKVREHLTEAQVQLPADRAAAYNEGHGLPTDFALGVATSMEKVFRRDVAFSGAFTDRLLIEAAGNETEAAQVVVVPIGRRLRDVTWSAEPLRGAAADVRLSVVPVGYVKSDTPALVTVTSPSDWWPDPLLGFLQTFDCPQDEVQPLWVSVTVPPGTRPGAYSTRLTVSARQAEPKTMGIRLRVYGFDVPKEQHLRTVWGVSEGNFARFYGDDYDEDFAWRYFGLFLSHRMAPGDLYRTRPTGIPGEDNVYHLASVGALRRLREAGSAWWNIGYVLAPKHALSGDPPTYQSYDEYLADCVRMFQPELERVREAGWPEGSYGIYFLDETSDFEALAKAARVMRDNFPDVPLMTTGYDRSYGVDRESPVADALDIWVPLTPRYAEDLERLQEGRKLGKRAWWYICVGPRGRQDLNWFVQYPAIRARLLMGAATWKYQPDGFLYYRVAGWGYNDRPITSGPLTDWLPRYHPGLPDGDGQIICAGPDGPLSTIRLENIRDGLEDYEYWWLLRDRVAGVRESRGDLPEAKLLGVPEELLVNLREYSEDPAVLYRVRRDVARAIERLSGRR